MGQEHVVTGRLEGLVDQVRETGRLHWRAMSRLGRISIAGVVVSAALAIALGLYIPRVAEDQALESREKGITSLVRVLEQERLVPPVGDHLSGADYQRFDDVVRGGLLGGENLRVKLWNPAGEVVYSDERSLVGQRFPIGSNLSLALAGSSSAEISDLSSEENDLDRGFGDRLLEFYVPLHGADGSVIGVFEIYQDFAPLASHLTTIRTAVWVAVGTGLSILLVFLVALFAGTARAMAREQRDAQDRAEDLAVLLETSRILSAEPAIDRTGPQVLRTLTKRLGLRSAGLVLEGHEPRFAFADAGDEAMCPLALAAARAARDRGGQITRTGRGDPALGHGAPGSLCSALATPFRVEPELTGALVACRESDRPLGSRERLLVSGVAAQLGVAAEGSKLFADLQQMTEARGRLLRRLVNAQEEERRHLVGDLHDGLGQTLTRILYGLRGSRARLGAEHGEVTAELARLESLTDEQSRNLRRYMAAIEPALLEDFGLPRALEALAREQEAESGIPIDVDVGPVPELHPAAAVTVFRAAQEAVMNVRKHAGASRMAIRLAQLDGTIVLEVSDDGKGTAELRGGIGLTYMRDRAASLGGRVDVISRPGTGTTVKVCVPFEVGHGDPDTGR